MTAMPADRAGPPDVAELDPDLAQFVRLHMPSFQAWELLHLLGDNPGLTGTLEDLAARLARRPDDPQLVHAAAYLTERGVLRQTTTTRGRALYRLAPGPHRDVLRRLCERYSQEPEFRLRLMYQIMMAS